MSRFSIEQVSHIETTCGSLLYELQTIWDEVGVSDSERDEVLFELEQECLEVYRRKVDQANHSRAYLRQAIADVEAELASICSAMGERPVHIRQSTQNAASLMEELEAISPQLEEMRKRKSDRLSKILEVMEQISKISGELRPNGKDLSAMGVDETDLSMRKLEDLQRQLEALQREKADRLKQVLHYLTCLNALCIVLGMDFKQTVTEVHPSLNEGEGSKGVSDDVIEKLASSICRIREIKIQRMVKLQDLATSMLELWDLMDTPIQEQQLFQNVTSNVAASEDEISKPNILSIDFLNYIEAEVMRLEQLKVSKMKELVLKRKSELEELHRKTHLVAKGGSHVEITIQAIEAGVIDPSLALEQIDSQIAGVKEEAYSRREILERVEKWMAACEEEAWLEEYNRDENRYSAGRGAHLILKRAEKARVSVQRISGSVAALYNKVIIWEKERGTEFTYDGIRLLSMIEEYLIVRQEKEQERKRQRDEKKLQSQLITEQEALFGSKPSPSKPQSAKKMPRFSSVGPSRRFSLGVAAMQPTKLDLCSKKSPVKKLSYNQSKPLRKPFAATNNRDQSETLRKPFTPSNAFNKIVEEEENMTPKAMQTASTPVPVSFAYEASPTIARTVQEVEYSFEERRLAFYMRRY